MLCNNEVCCGAEEKETKLREVRGHLGGQMAGYGPRRGLGCRNRAPTKLREMLTVIRRSGKSYSHVHVVTTGYMT